MDPEPIFRIRGRVVAVTALVVLAMTIVRVLAGGIYEDRQAREWIAKGNVPEAIAAYDRSLHWYLPGSPTVARATRGLRGIAKDAETRGDLDTALTAWRVIRSGMYASRWLVVPGRPIIDECNAEIARLVGAQAAKVDPASAKTAAARETAILTRETGPSVAWSLIALAGFFGWIAAAVSFIFRAFGPAGTFHRRAAAQRGAVFLLAYAVWMFALSRA